MKNNGNDANLFYYRVYVINMSKPACIKMVPGRTVAKKGRRDPDVS